MINKQLAKSMTARLPVFLPDDLLTVFLSLLPVKSLLRFKCVSNSWNSLISDPNFVKFHLKKSSQNPHFTLITHHIKVNEGDSPYGSDDEYEYDFSIIPYPICSFLDNPSFTLFVDHHYLLSEKDCSDVVGSCNGLICLSGCRFFGGTHLGCREYDHWLRLWNPATRAISEKFGCIRGGWGLGFSFGCDYSTGTFKVVASRYINDQLPREVRLLSFGDNVWRNIQNSSAEEFKKTGRSGIFFNGTLNWLAIHNDIPYTGYHNPENITTVNRSILSLDLRTETYNQYMLPRGFEELPPVQPIVSVLGDCLCFSYSHKETDFIIWQMKKFGDEESWTQFLIISYNDLQINFDFSGEDTVKYYIKLLPLILSEDGNTLILHCSPESQAILYNWRDNRMERTRVSVHKTIFDGTRNHLCWHWAYNFVESITPVS